VKHFPELGDLVRLKSGGPNMTVVAVDKLVSCCWFVGEVVSSMTVPSEALACWDDQAIEPPAHRGPIRKL